MLILKAFINEIEIDEIHIQNTGTHIKDFFMYKVRKPEGIGREFVHKRSKGWRPLAKQVLAHLISLEEK